MNYIKKFCRKVGFLVVQWIYKSRGDKNAARTYLGDDKKKRFDEIKEGDPYLNQIIDEVMHYVVYDLPLQPLILDVIHGAGHAEH